jgi:hypothetical protein
LADLQNCLTLGESSGVLSQIRNFALEASSLVLPLAAQNLEGNPLQAKRCPQPDGIPPATVRYMVFNYIDTNIDVVRNATNLFKRISNVTTEWIRSGVGGAATPPAELPLRGIAFSEETSSTFGSYRDFASVAGMTTDLSNPKAGNQGLPAQDIHLVFPCGYPCGSTGPPCRAGCRPTAITFPFAFPFTFTFTFSCSAGAGWNPHTEGSSSRCQTSTGQQAGSSWQARSSQQAGTGQQDSSAWQTGSS